jgi:hypothetical protein
MGQRIRNPLPYRLINRFRPDYFFHRHQAEGVGELRGFPEMRGAPPK